MMRGERRGERGNSIVELSDAMMDWAILCAGAALLAIVLHLVIRTAGLRWTWALLVLFAAPVLALGNARVGLVAGASAAGAIAIGISWERHGMERRGIEAQQERERRGPWSVLRALVEVRGARLALVKEDRLALGSTPSRGVRTIPFGSRQGVRGLIVGAPGTGKTVSMASIAAAYADQGKPVVCVDPKGDPSLAAALAASAVSSGASFLEWSHEGPAIYNPLARGDATEIADKALAGETWTEPHYLRQAQRYLGWELRAMQEAHILITPLSVATHMDANALEALSDRCTEQVAAGLRRYLDSLSTRQRAELGGVRDRLAVLAESRLGRWLDPAAGEEVIDLGRAWRKSCILYFRLDADRYPLASEMLAAAIVSDLVSLTGELQQRASLGLVAIDEFAAVGAHEALRVLSRSRSAGVSVVLATQGLADLDAAGSGTEGGAFARRVLTQLDFLIAHRQPESESAEVLATMTGTRPVWVTTRRVDWRFSDPKDSTGSRTREREFIRHPDEFKKLGVGEAIVIEPASSREAERVRVWTREHSRGVGKRRGDGASRVAWPGRIAR
jgi:helicase HerA-like protein/type IV secretory system conjugative DNA transfer VirD4/TraG family protein